jgi:hypothetical protein
MNKKLLVLKYQSIICYAHMNSINTKLINYLESNTNSYDLGRHCPCRRGSASSQITCKDLPVSQIRLQKILSELSR